MSLFFVLDDLFRLVAVLLLVRLLDFLGVLGAPRFGVAVLAIAPLGHFDLFYLFSYSLIYYHQ